MGNGGKGFSYKQLEYKYPAFFFSSGSRYDTLSVQLISGSMD